MEQEPGSSGLSVIDYYSRRILYGYDFRGVKSTGSKVQRAMPIAAQAERGNVRLLRGDWNSRFLDEAYAFPEGVYDDQVDAVAGAFSALAISRDAASTSSIASHEPAIIRHGDLTLRGDRYKDKE
jgi:predicted phage terminase large subunit-like protein